MNSQQPLNRMEHKREKYMSGRKEEKKRTQKDTFRNVTTYFYQDRAHTQ